MPSLWWNLPCLITTVICFKVFWQPRCHNGLHCGRWGPGRTNFGKWTFLNWFCLAQDSIVWDPVIGLTVWHTIILFCTYWRLTSKVIYILKENEGHCYLRANMLAHRFARCTRDVIITLFCTWSLWVREKLAVLFGSNTITRLGHCWGLVPRFCSASGMFAEEQMDCFYATLRQRYSSLVYSVRGRCNSILSMVTEWTVSILAISCGM